LIFVSQSLPHFRLIPADRESRNRVGGAGLPRIRLGLPGVAMADGFVRIVRQSQTQF
jgi:hypothetical protein